MKTINLFLKIHTTSLSPDGQIISLAIVSEELIHVKVKEFIKTGEKQLISSSDGTKFFYAEFTDYDLNRCDNFVKENIVSKLLYTNHEPKLLGYFKDDTGFGDTKEINSRLTNWLSQFSEYKLNFIVDCGWFAWYKFIELMGKWEEVNLMFPLPENISDDNMGFGRYDTYIKVGLPKLTANFPPVCQDLNELIALKKGINVSEAFELDRDAILWPETNKNIEDAKQKLMKDGFPLNYQFNALWDAKVTKEIYNKLIWKNT